MTTRFKSANVAHFCQNSLTLDSGGGLIGMLFMIIVAPIAAMLIQFAISRSREYTADRGGAAICGNPLALASALHRLESYKDRFEFDLESSLWWLH